MKKLLTFFFLLQLISFTLLAQAPTVEWSKVYDGQVISNVLNGCNVHQTREGNYIIGGICGVKQLHHIDCFIMLTDMYGDTILTRVYGEEDVQDYVVSLQPINDGGYGVFGYKPEKNKLRLFKLNSNYEIQWDKEYLSYNDSILWTQANWMENTSDSGFILLGTQQNSISRDFHLINTDQFGNVISHKTFYWKDESPLVFNVSQTNDGGFIVSGYVQKVSEYKNFLHRLNEDGDSLWTKFYDFDGNTHTLPTSDDGFLITGGRYAAIMNLIKTDELGEITWEKQFNEPGYGIRSIEYSNGGFITIGKYLSSSTVYNHLVKISDAGDSLWSVKWEANEIPGVYDYPIDLKETADNGFIVLGVQADLWGNVWGLFLTKLTFEPNEIKELSQDISGNFRLIQNFPNPFNPSTKIQYSVNSTQKFTLKVFDLLGREIATLVNEEKPANTYEITWDPGNLPSGVYFYQLRAGNYIDTKKMILLK